MSFSKIADVNVVAHASSIFGRVVVAENSDVLDVAVCCFQHERDEVRVRLVTFTTVGRRAGRIEIT